MTTPNFQTFPVMKKECLSNKIPVAPQVEIFVDTWQTLAYTLTECNVAGFFGKHKWLSSVASALSAIKTENTIKKLTNETYDVQEAVKKVNVSENDWNIAFNEATDLSLHTVVGLLYTLKGILESVKPAVGGKAKKAPKKTTKKTK